MEKNNVVKPTNIWIEIGYGFIYLVIPAIISLILYFLLNRKEMVEITYVVVGSIELIVFNIRWWKSDYTQRKKTCVGNLETEKIIKKNHMISQMILFIAGTINLLISLVVLLTTK